MSKAVLIMDMPKHCIDCPCHFAGMHTVVCGAKRERLLTDDIETYKPDWCPLRELPEKKSVYTNGHYTDGYNACIDELLGEENG